MLHIFGIRHHGPGSTRSLLQALETLAPDIVLVEAPADAESQVSWIAHEQMTPPVALLIYNPKMLSQAAFYPFAEFSPEWQAMRYALREKIPVRMMDLPMSIGFAQPDRPEKTPGGKRYDPFTELAGLAGYSDPERWWEAAVERQHPEARQGDIFDAILELMRALRAAKNQTESPETLLREAHMRQTIRTAQKEGFERIAVVCGAWHGPALADTPQVKAASDTALLKGLKKIKTEATWIPWSFERLARQSGYAAGVVAPFWYRILYQNTTAPATEWLSLAARLLREHGLDTSSSHVIEAVRLAESLSHLRRTAQPGIDELREAAVTVLCEGAEKPVELIERELVVGDVLGAVPDQTPVPPLKADFEAQAKSCRLERSSQEKSLHLDLREPAQLRKSQLLHRLLLLGIPWGKTEETGSGKQGSFHENWTIGWQPEYEIRLIEAGAWGNTIEEAGNQKARRQIALSEHLPGLTALLGQLLKADLGPPIPLLLEKLRETAALSRDTMVLADAIPPLVEALRYGHARQLDLGAVEMLLDGLIPRFCLQLPGASTGLSPEAAAEILPRILAVNRAIDLLQHTGHRQAWHSSLSAVAGHPGSAPLLSGLSRRLLFDQGLSSAEEAAAALHFWLSPAQAPGEAVGWLEGFLQGSGLLLIHHAALRELLDAWLSELPEGLFREQLPLLRRTFSRFTGPEREKLLDLARTGPGATQAAQAQAADSPAWDAGRAAELMPLLRQIFQD